MQRRWESRIKQRRFNKPSIKPAPKFNRLPKTLRQPLECSVWINSALNSKVSNKPPLHNSNKPPLHNSNKPPLHNNNKLQHSQQHPRLNQQPLSLPLSLPQRQQPLNLPQPNQHQPLNRPQPQQPVVVDSFLKILVMLGEEREEQQKPRKKEKPALCASGLAVQHEVAVMPATPPLQLDHPEQRNNRTKAK
jgi:hypothetical protein